MKVKVMTAILPLVLCAALAAGVQERSDKDSSQGKSMTVTGCLQAGSTPNSFVLNNVGETSATGWKEPGQTPSAMARSEVNSYMLIPSGNISFQDWVGQRVQITGKMKQDSSPGRSESEGDVSSSTPSTSGMPQLTVTSVKKASGSCQ